ncbi:S-adenosyl-L-methionine-dependent methyltransferase superfamily protein isoform 1 [Dorcoceras hygrometricum]|uniref:S-adenosyl-L-methionine-dependent methyltransferase superfamily protein isoform 1 n=1 Tax=Dorcoceras hygrometricum TaxID=472368 RepID=A0A2Z7BYR1_9LAMI|nr:S-adenosyl-L-methionine-dependent methyltransferase superfamily protein isoform 1 [Dorcoceras hygrometricum]
MGLAPNEVKTIFNQSNIAPRCHNLMMSHTLPNTRMNVIISRKKLKTEAHSHGHEINEEDMYKNNHRTWKKK